MSGWDYSRLLKGMLTLRPEQLEVLPAPEQSTGYRDWLNARRR